MPSIFNDSPYISPQPQVYYISAPPPQTHRPTPPPQIYHSKTFQNIDDSKIDLLCSAIKDYQRGTHLVLRRSIFSDESWGKFLDTVAQSNKITRLSLNCMGLDDTHTTLLENFIKKSFFLKKLTLAGNHFHFTHSCLREAARNRHPPLKVNLLG